MDRWIRVQGTLPRAMGLSPGRLLFLGLLEIRPSGLEASE